MSHKVPTVEEVLARYLHAPYVYEREDGTYQFGVVTEYDGTGELVDDTVEDLNEELEPLGWRAEWTGNGNQDEEDVRVFPAPEDD